MMWNTTQFILAIFFSLIVGAILSFLFARWFFGKQLREAEKNYQQLVRKIYQEMGNFFGRKMKEEDLNRITAQLKEGTEKEKNPKTIKSQPKRRKKK